MDWNFVLILAGLALVLTEVLLGGFAGFDLVLIGVALAAGGIVGHVSGDLRLALGVAAALGVLELTIGRRHVRRWLATRRVASNADALLGRTARVTARIAEHEPGQVRVNDEVWRAVPAAGSTGPFEPGAVVTVERVEGVTLEVR